jgi:hypothetical protein
LALEFWTALATAARDYRPCEMIAAAAANLVPHLLVGLVEDPSEHLIGCLSAFVSAAGDTLGHLIVPFVYEHGVSAAALVVIYCALDLEAFYPVLLSCIDGIAAAAADFGRPVLQDTALFVLGHAIGRFPQLLEGGGRLPFLLNIVQESVTRRSDVAKRCFEVLFHVFSGLVGQPAVDSALFPERSRAIAGLFQEVVLSPLVRDPPFMTAVFEAFNAFLSRVPAACEDLLLDVLRDILSAISGDESADFQFVSLLWSVVTTVLHRLACLDRFRESDLAADVWRAVLAGAICALAERDANIYEEVLIAIDTVAVVFPGGFGEFQGVLIEPVVEALETGEPRIVCQAAQLLGDMFDAPSDDVLGFVPRLYDELLRLSQSAIVPRDMRPFFVRALVSVTAHAGDRLERRFFDLMVVLGKLQAAPINPAIDDDLKFAQHMLEVVLEGYVLALEIFDDRARILLNIRQIMEPVRAVMNIPCLTLAICDSALRLLHRLVQTAGYDFCRLLPDYPESAALLDQILQSPDEATPLVAKATQLGAEIERCMETML